MAADIPSALFTPPVLSIAIGGVLLFLGIVGGGIEVKGQIVVPKVDLMARLLAIIAGICLLGVGLGVHLNTAKIDKPAPTPTPVIVPTTNIASQPVQTPAIPAATSKPQPLPPKSTLPGTWRGVIAFPEMDKLHFVLHIRANGNVLSAVADSPDQSQYSLPVDSINTEGITGHIVHFEMNDLGVSFTGVWSGNQISGKFLQRGRSSDVVLVKS